ncbi:MAG: hypothetical protein JXA25_17945, partial [Anaerolineales bacterium]|nr:hypothetical protein [Anaerolineales bacterium]
MSDETFESRDTTPEIKENTEQKENPALEDSTLNPDTRVEQTQNFNTAEAIETALTATINNTLAETTSASTSSDDGSELMTEAETGPAASRGEVSATPINTPDPRENISETSTVTMDRVSDEPDHGPCPFTDEVVQDSQGASSPGEGISATPINLPYPVEGQAETG